MNANQAYVTDIPQDAEERVIASFPDGAKHEAEYWLNGQRVGLRRFFPTGELEGEYTFRNGVRHGMEYRWTAPGVLLSAEPYKNGLPHGTAYQWADDGQPIGAYTLEHGTGIDLWWQDYPGFVFLAEVRYMQDGQPHGFEWWLNDDQESVWIEKHWLHWDLHGIERQWNAQGRLGRGYPRYWVQGNRVRKRQYLRASAQDPSLPPFRAEENDPRRVFPPEIQEHLGPNRMRPYDPE